MPHIRSLKPNVSQDEATEAFSNGLLEPIRRVLFGPLKSVADFYIPFRLFQVEISNRGTREQRIFGLDAVEGSLDLYHFEELPPAARVIYMETRNCAETVIDEAKARQLLITKVQRLLFATGFFRLRNPSIAAEPIPGEIHVPYWVGFRGRGIRPRVVVIDAVRRRIEGPKVRRLLRNWLTSVRQTSG